MKKTNPRQLGLFEDNSKIIEVATRKWSSFNDAIFEYYEKEQKNIVIRALAGSGKCLGRGTPVMKFSGNIVPVESVKVGDLLMGPDSKPRKVLSTTLGVGELFKISPVKGDPWVCNGVHVLTLVGTNLQMGRTIDVQLDEHLENCKNNKERPDRNWKLVRSRVEFASKNVWMDPYLLGLWIGDGTTDAPSITNCEPEIIDFCKNSAEKLGCECVLRYEDKKNTYNISFKSLTLGDGGGSRHGTNYIRDFLRNECLRDGHKIIPKDYLFNSRQSRLALLAGILDTDGYVSKSSCDLCTVSKTLRDQILFLCRSLGFAAYSSVKVATIKSIGFVGNYHRISISGDMGEIPCKVPRRMSAKRKQVKRVNVTGFSVSPIGSGEYFGFELDGDGRFLLGDFTVTHNSTTLRELVKRTPSSLVLAFNSAAKKEFEQKLKDESYLLSGKEKRRYSAKVMTFHGLGFRSIISRLGKPEQDPSMFSERMKGIIKDKYPALGFEKINAIAKMTRYARNYVKFTDKMWMNAITRSGVFDLWDEDDASEAVEIAQNCIEASVDISQNPKILDFEDMNYVPFRQKWYLDSAETVFVDETQDLSEVQVAMLWKSKAKDARVVAVGDEFQCHPKTSSIRLASGEYANVAELYKAQESGVKHLAMGWDSVAMKPRNSGRELKISAREYNGKMISLTIANMASVDVTPNHKLCFRWRKDSGPVFCVCLVEDWSGKLHLSVRHPGDIYDDEFDAKVWMVAWSYDGEFADKIKGTYDGVYDFGEPEDVQRLMEYHDLFLEYPMYPPPETQSETSYMAPPIYAANLKTNLFELFDANGVPQTIIDKDVTPYSGVVYSLDVTADHAYVADGVAVLNSIYAFRGADSFAMPRVIRALEANIMPLPVTYRCAQAIVRVAARFAPDIRAREDAPEGILKTITPDEMRSMWRPGDLLVSRANAPLIGNAIAAMKQGIPAYVEGRAEDMGIDTLLRKFDKSGTRFSDVLKAAKAWAEEEKRRFLALEDKDSAASVEDRVQTLLALSEGCSNSADVMRRLNKLMHDATNTGSIRMSTVHKAKGSEAERVFMLTDTFRLGGRDAAEAQEERNLYYVAVTRAKNELYFVKSPA